VRAVTISANSLRNGARTRLLVTRAAMVAFKSAKKHAMNQPKPAPAAEESQYCSTRAAADLLGISIKTAQSYRRILRTSVESLLRERKGLLTRPAARSAAFTILAVDDDPEMRQLYEMHLGEWDARTRLLTANNGFEALLRIGQEAPRVLIADLNMPGMDGFRMVHSLRANPDHAALNIIIVSALSAAEINDQGGLPTDIPVFTKPVAFEKLKQRLSEFMS
jgi:CheY-like chemotaxis protein